MKLPPYRRCGRECPIGENIVKSVNNIFLSDLSHIYVHSKTVLCVDAMSDLIVSGGVDRIIKLVKLGPCGLSRTVHTLQGHRQRVLSLKIGQGLVISGSADRTARIWSTKSGNCIRVLVHELEVCYAICFPPACLRLFLRFGLWILTVSGS